MIEEDALTESDDQHEGLGLLRRIARSIMRNEARRGAGHGKKGRRQGELVEVHTALILLDWGKMVSRYHPKKHRAWWLPRWRLGTCPPDATQT
ncbi:hypothetical protein GCM10011415_04580 [Salipiger pallidus]|uniref:Uncharacterized protein n=1 Tax=Salipiger pallidus TaxID=1775170 RepID=A0A8J2ZGV2_9RHOB|nr:hypothetical protein [Salipiger pallidus]GGG61532.1 hypothetical protein GCM10011415_04580 [Salipiger pallidus]